MTPVRHARLPTPLVRLDRLSADVGAEVWAKRDDWTGFELSGNKVRKLEHLLAPVRLAGVTHVITCGGLQSNHARATAVATRRLGLVPVLLLRGSPPETPDSNLLIDALLGADLRFCDADTYRHRRNDVMRELAAEVAASGGQALVIPEGGSDGVGARAYAEATRELLGQAGGPFDAVAVAVGSGGTLAGLALGAPIGRIHGYAVCDDRAYFIDAVRRIASEAGLPLPDPGTTWDVDDAYRGAAYGVADAAVWGTIARVARLEGVLLDPVYTGKAMHGLLSEIAAGRVGGRVLFWHTGGGFGLFGRGDEVVQHLGPVG